ncbi:hypothetical protein H257_09815 [Aphanomyces astaci]|uniref:RxLR effector protein n=1 Tax=Aphanomyces astaci TaxID=112090 RepID=W4G9G2_APHAT|nr:hypothetical protein H257_09810 [Aphanomyces astaci]XP_009834474.1 hypothetical protein H257_09812 [Aphanomyces astaci]XP_009834477.1 hypothetical protein H257_09815 [Aphanomyces astaci]ETV76347.1 hypothetical protein H257_09810 [Aphanomyces astaci]ETV76349.1 hypothetical protein H257_09812 [Aphanomyces astaci]ETV76352.1 hypothetical protein H257_09815 [Aphanomyces astaci]|eukprot:XP_009834472.1 hypothetical protein H257_09810 [Aphanomyces astaci]
MHSSVVFTLAFVSALATASTTPAAPETPVSNKLSAGDSKDDKEWLGWHRPIVRPVVAIPVVPIVPVYRPVYRPVAVVGRPLLRRWEEGAKATDDESKSEYVAAAVGRRGGAVVAAGPRHYEDESKATP